MRSWWLRCILGIGLVVACAGMNNPWVASRHIVIRPEIELLLEDIRSEPTPDDISELVSKATRHRRNGSWGDGSLDENNLAPDEVAHVTRYLRQKYPFESIRHRLDYEPKAKRTKPKLTTQAHDWINELEGESTEHAYVKWPVDYVDARADALETLHSDEVVAFINRDGEGVSRMPSIGAEYVLLPDISPVPIDAEETEPPPLLTNVGNRYREKRNEFFALHADYRQDFAGTRNGLVISANKVAGFAPHAVTHRKDIMSINKASTYSKTNPESEIATPVWRVAKLQLVSLLKYDRPKVYVSEFLPAMTELLNLEMRELDSFEQKSLQQLYSGEDLVRETKESDIRMMGSLRATKNCMECHSADRGELLGAFSYQLTRVADQVP
ncbi:MAG: hypothetical protein WBD20_24460 [Pirellulaceae bacterium]